jgi:hypothetical protein
LSHSILNVWGDFVEGIAGILPCRARPQRFGRHMAAVRADAAFDLGAKEATFPLDLAVPDGGAGLANVAATGLNLLGFEVPEDYERSLLLIRRGAATRTI